MTEYLELAESFSEMRDEAVMEALHDIKAGVETQPWRLIDPDLAQRIWMNYTEMDFVENTKGLEKIREIAVENIVKLYVNTELCGHTPSLPLDEMEDVGVSREELDETPYFDIGSSWRISDYAIGPLMNLLFLLMRATTPEDTLYIIDRILSVSHQRSDLASWFIKGGTSSLDRLGGFDD